MCSLWIIYYKDKFIIAINFFLSLAVFRFILNNNLILNDIKYQLCYLKRCLYTEKRNSICSLLQVFFLLLLVQSLQSSYFLVFYHFGFETTTLTFSHIIDFDDATNLFLNKYIHAR
jgi:hypothetical protein